MRNYAIPPYEEIELTNIMIDSLVYPTFNINNQRTRILVGKPQLFTEIKLSDFHGYGVMDKSDHNYRIFR